MPPYKWPIMMVIALICLGLTSPMILADDEEEIHVTDLSELPDEIKAAAEAAMEGLTITGYMTETELGQFMYEVIGTVEDRCYEIEVTEDAKVLEIEECD